MKKALRTVFVLLAVCCVVGAFAMLGQPAAKSGKFTYTLAEITFACNKLPYSLNFSVVNFLPFLMLFMVAVMAPFEIASIYVKQKEGKRKLSSTGAVVFATLLLIAAGVLILFALSFVEPVLLGNPSKAAKKEFISHFRQNFKMGGGIIGMAVLSFLGAAMLIAATVTKLVMKDKD